MTTELTATTTAPSEFLQNLEFLTGHITKPYLKDGKLLGAVLAFPNRKETALLHVRQMTGERPLERLAAMCPGDPLLVRIIVQQDGVKRKSVWATEQGVEYTFIVDMLQSDPEKFRGLEGSVHSLTEHGTFIELLDGPAQGHRGLLRPSGGRVTLGSFVAFRPKDLVIVDMAEARIDDKNKLLVRLENARPRLKH